jgi:Pyridoxamine 5'-phosphate oxidase
LAVVATWSEFESAAPRMAAVAWTLWPGITAQHRGEPKPDGAPWFSVAFLATIRPDGSPRLHPFCPVLAAGRLFAAIPMSSPKGDDLRRDPRCAIHALPGPDDDELSIRARAIEAGNDPAVRAAAIAAVMPSEVGGMIETVRADPIFEFDVIRVDVARWLDIGQPGTRAERQTWKAR